MRSHVSNAAAILVLTLSAFAADKPSTVAIFNPGGVGVTDPTVYEINEQICGRDGKNAVLFCLPKMATSLSKYQDIDSFVRNFAKVRAKWVKDAAARAKKKGAAPGSDVSSVLFTDLSNNIAGVVIDPDPKLTGPELRIQNGVGQPALDGKVAAYLRLPLKTFSQKNLDAWVAGLTERDTLAGTLSDFLTADPNALLRKKQCADDAKPTFSELFDAKAIRIRKIKAGDKDYSNALIARAEIDRAVSAKQKLAEEQMIESCKKNVGEHNESVSNLQHRLAEIQMELAELFLHSEEKAKIYSLKSEKENKARELNALGGYQSTEDCLNKSKYTGPIGTSETEGCKGYMVEGKCKV